jgi:hypothetical protein
MSPTIPGIRIQFSYAGLDASQNLFNWSRWEELNAPSAEYYSAALALSYTGPEKRNLYHFARNFSAAVMALWGSIPIRPRWSPNLRATLPFSVSGM